MQDLYADRVSQSHDEFEPCVHSDVYVVNRDSPVEYEHHHMQAVLYQSDGARRDVDRLKHRCTCGARRTERHNKLKNKGEDFSRFRNTLRGRGGAAKGGFLISRPILFGLEDTARRKIQIEAALIRSIQDASIHPIKACKLGLQFRFRSEFCFGFFYCFFCFFFYLLSI